MKNPFKFKTETPAWLDHNYVELVLVANAFSNKDKVYHYTHIDNGSSKAIIVTNSENEFDVSKIKIHARNIVCINAKGKTYKRPNTTLGLRKLTAKQIAGLRIVPLKDGSQRVFLSKSLIRDLT